MKAIRRRQERADLAEVYKRAIVLVRSLWTLLRILPADRLQREISGARARPYVPPPPVHLAVRIRGGGSGDGGGEDDWDGEGGEKDSAFLRLDRSILREDGGSSWEPASHILLGPLVTPHGELSLRVTYRRDCIFSLASEDEQQVHEDLINQRDASLPANPPPPQRPQIIVESFENVELSLPGDERIFASPAENVPLQKRRSSSIEGPSALVYQQSFATSPLGIRRNSDQQLPRSHGTSRAVLLPSSPKTTNSSGGSSLQKKTLTSHPNAADSSDMEITKFIKASESHAPLNNFNSNNPIVDSDSLEERYRQVTRSEDLQALAVWVISNDNSLKHSSLTVLPPKRPPMSPVVEKDDDGEMDAAGSQSPPALLFPF